MDDNNTGGTAVAEPETATEGNESKRTYVRYTPEQQTAILARASEVGIAVAAKENGVPYTTVKRWLTASGGGVTSSTTKRGRGRPRGSKNVAAPSQAATITTNNGSAASNVQFQMVSLTASEQLDVDQVRQILASRSRESATRILSYLKFTAT